MYSLGASKLLLTCYFKFKGKILLYFIYFSKKSQMSIFCKNALFYWNEISVLVECVYKKYFFLFKNSFLDKNKYLSFNHMTTIIKINAL